MTSEPLAETIREKMPAALLNFILTLLSVLGSLLLMWAIAISREVMTHTEDIAIIKAEARALKETVGRIDQNVIEIREAVVTVKAPGALRR